MKHQIEVTEELKKNYSGFYDNDVEEWRRLGAIDKANNILKLCSAIAHDTVLEVGAGDGAVLSRLDSLGFASKLHALDISESGVRRIKARGIKTLASSQVFDGYVIPFADKTFDLLILTHVLEHVEHPRLLLTEASRVARSIFVEVPLDHTARLPDNYVFDSVGHINHYCPLTIRYLLQTSGFHIRSEFLSNPSLPLYLYAHGKSGYLKFWLKEMTMRIAPVFATRRFGYHYSILCDKE